eukprot:708351-Pleurochrysis_carterae.AAC.1
MRAALKRALFRSDTTAANPAATTGRVVIIFSLFHQGPTDGTSGPEPPVKCVKPSCVDTTAMSTACARRNGCVWMRRRRSERRMSKNCPRRRSGRDGVDPAAVEVK